MIRKGNRRFTEMARLKALRREEQFGVDMLNCCLDRLKRHQRMIEQDLWHLNTYMVRYPYLRKYYISEGLRQVVDNTRKKPGRYRPEPLDAA
jgi:hypothetical protein